MIDQSRKFYFSPQDDIGAVFVKFIQGAKKEILIADYSFNLVPLVDLLLEKAKLGVDVRLVLDRSQSKGKTEEPEVARLKEAMVPMVIGTSEDHRIMHDKYAVVDGSWVEHGSWNMTKVASLESNFIVIEHNTQIAGIFAQDWEFQWDWIEKNENQADS